MAQITELSKIQVPLGGQQIELQQIDHAEEWADAMQQWAQGQK